MYRLHIQSQSMSPSPRRKDSDGLTKARGKITKVISQWHIKEEQTTGGFLIQEDKVKLGPPPKKQIYAHSQDNVGWMNPHLKTGHTPTNSTDIERVVEVETTVSEQPLEPVQPQSLSKAQSYSAKSVKVPSALKEAQEELRLLSSQNNTFRKENRALKGQLDSLKRRNGELGAANKRLNESIAAMKSSDQHGGREHEAEIRRLKERIDALQKELDFDEEKISKLAKVAKVPRINLEQHDKEIHGCYLVANFNILSSPLCAVYGCTDMFEQVP